MAALRRRPSAVSDQLEHPPRGLRDLRPGAEDRLHARTLEEGVVLGGDDAAAGDDDVPVAETLELLHELRHERLVAARLSRDADHVHVVLDRLARDLLRGLEEHAHVDVEAQVGEGGGDHLGAAVVPVLADLGDQHAGPPPVVGGEALHFGAQRLPLLVVGELAAVDARDGADLGMVAAPHLLERARDLADRGARTGGLDREREEVPLPRLGGARERVEGRVQPGLVARLADALEAQIARMSMGGSEASWNLLTPTITSSPRSMRAWRRAAVSSMRSLGMPASSAFVMPPIASTSSMMPSAFWASAWVRDSMK